MFFLPVLCTYFCFFFGLYLNKSISLSERELFPNTFINFQLLHYKIVTDNN